MNERIRELAKSAGVDAGQMLAEILCNADENDLRLAQAWNSQPDDLRQRIFELINLNQEKFAELIVQECVGRIELQRRMDESIPEWVYNNLQEDIKEHFGAEQ